ncbi:MAG TPA: tetratricopeptide repeat protein [Gemmatimonadaceae bacterium]
MPSAPIHWIAALCIVSATVLAFWPTAHNGWVSWDDTFNFLSNAHYRGLGGEQLSWMWSTFHLGHYTPLTWMTLGLDFKLWGMQPGGYHLTSLLLHTVNAVLWYHLALRLLVLARVFGTTTALNDRRTIVSAVFAALLFAIHPLRVESVAWITERRDVVSLLFCFSSVLAYLQSRKHTEALDAWYWAALLFFVAALLSKAIAVTLPVVLLVLNAYPLRRLRGISAPQSLRVYLELAPFFALAAGAVVLTLVALEPPEQLSLAQKVLVSAYSLCFYIVKLLVPVRLSPLYEMPAAVKIGDPTLVAGAILAVALSALAFAVRHRWPGLATCWLVFVIVSLPLLGIVQNGPQIAADRYTYHSAAALTLPVAAGFGFLLERRRRLVYPAGVAIVMVLGALTWRQTEFWRDGATLWTRAIEMDDASGIAHSALASEYYAQNRVTEGLAQSRRAAELAPTYAEAHNNLGIGLTRTGDADGARAEYLRALELKPVYDEAENNIGVLLGRSGDLSGAISHYRRALFINDENADAHVNLGNALLRKKQPNEAIAEYQRALEIRPSDADAELNWGVALANGNDLAGAVTHFRAALAIDPAHAEASAYLARAERSLH